MKRLWAIIGCGTLFLLLIQVGLGSNGQKDEKNTPEALIKAARFLEQKPLDKDAKKVRTWAIEWVISTDKVSVKACSLLNSRIDKKYKYANELFGQYIMGMAVYKLANPDKASDEDAAQLAGFESALISYQAILTEQPKASTAFMEELVAKRSQGALSGYVKENNCKDN